MSALIVYRLAEYAVACAVVGAVVAAAWLPWIGLYKLLAP